MSDPGKHKKASVPTPLKNIEKNTKIPFLVSDFRTTNY